MEVPLLQRRNLGQAEFLGISPIRRAGKRLKEADDPVVRVYFAHQFNGAVDVFQGLKGRTEHQVGRGSDPCSPRQVKRLLDRILRIAAFPEICPSLFASRLHSKSDIDAARRPH